MLYYLFCVKLGRDEQEYFTASIGKVLAMINLWQKEQEKIAGAINGDNGTVRKFSDIKGLV